MNRTILFYFFRGCLNFMIPQPPWPTIGKRLESAVRKALFSFSMLENIPKLGLALSGGKDSLAMLLLLHAISGRGAPPFEMKAFHITEERPSQILIEICSALNIPLITHTQPSQYDNCYSCSRKRRKKLFQLAKEHDCPCIAFGHHRDDNAQTLLMNLLHKGEFAGLLPKIKLYTYDITIIRPLIYVQESDIQKFISHFSLHCSTCTCPFGETRLRKRTDSLITTLETLFPNAKSNLANAALKYGSRKALNRP